MLLGLWQIDAGAVAALEARLTHLHLFAFQFAGDADDGNHHIGSARRGQSLRLGLEVDFLPDQAHHGLTILKDAILGNQLDGLACLQMRGNEFGFDRGGVIGGSSLFTVNGEAEVAQSLQAQVIVGGLVWRQGGFPSNAERFDSPHMRR